MVFKIKLKELFRKSIGGYVDILADKKKEREISKKKSVVLYFGSGGPNKALESTYYTFRTVKTVHVLLLVFYRKCI